LGIVQLGKLPKNNLRRQKLTEIYRDSLAEIAPEVSMPFSAHPGQSAYHILPVLLPKDCDRLRFMDSMKAQGIQTSIHYPPIHTFQAYQSENRHASGLAVTESVAMREVTLPLYPDLPEEGVLEVVQSVARAISQARIG
jgi:dTDP-4-amino-4,6-dideoxygalactose transaminase